MKILFSRSQSIQGRESTKIKEKCKLSRYFLGIRSFEKNPTKNSKKTPPKKQEHLTAGKLNRTAFKTSN